MLCRPSDLPCKKAKITDSSQEIGIAEKKNILAEKQKGYTLLDTLAEKLLCSKVASVPTLYKL